MKKKSMVFICIFILILVGGYLRVDSQEKVIEKELYNKIVDIGVPKEKISKTIYRKDYLKGNRGLYLYLKNAPEDYYFISRYSTTFSKLFFNFDLKNEVEETSTVGATVEGGTIYGADNNGDYKGKNPKDYIPEDIYKYLE